MRFPQGYHRKTSADLTPSTAQILSPHVFWVNYMFLVGIDGSLCGGGTVSIYASPAMTTISSILSSKAIPRHLSSPLEEGRNSLAGRRRLQERGLRNPRALGFTDLRISKEDPAVRHIGKDTSVNYESRGR